MPPLGQRTRPPARHRPVYAPVSLWDQIDAQAQALGISRSEFVVRAVETYLPTLSPVPTENISSGTRDVL